MTASRNDDDRIQDWSSFLTAIELGALSEVSG
jgi:hypothetical protein